MNQVLKYTDATNGASLQTAFGMILSDSLLKKATGFTSLSGKEQWNNLDFVTQSNPVLPCMFTLKDVDWNEVDHYTLEANDEQDETVWNEITQSWELTGEKIVAPIARVCGGHMLGNFTDVLFPKYDPNQDNMLTDMYAACVASACKNDFQASYGYLRIGQMLNTFFRENSEVVFQTDQNRSKMIPKLFKI